MQTGAYRSWQDAAYSYGRSDVVFSRDLGQAWLLPRVAYEYRYQRHPLIRVLTRLCLDRPRLSRTAMAALALAARAGDRLGREAVPRHAYSGIFNLRYYQGMADELGGATSSCQVWPAHRRRRFQEFSRNTRRSGGKQDENDDRSVQAGRAALDRARAGGRSLVVTLGTTLKLLYRHRALRAMLWFRFGTWCKHKHIPGLTGAVQRHIMRHYGLEILVGADIGGGLYIAHPVGCVIAPASMGRNCSVIASTTIGMRNTWEFPVIGDNVFIGAGARVLGGIRVGDNASIGANAVVIRDVPPGATAIGVPAHTDGRVALA